MNLSSTHKRGRIAAAGGDLINKGKSKFNQQNQFGLNAANDWLEFAGYGEGLLGAGQIGMLKYRQLLPISSKIGSMSRFSSAYKIVGVTREGLGYGGYLGAGINTYLDYESLKDDEIGSGRFAYRTTGTLSSIFGGAIVGSEVGGPWGAVAGTIISGASWAGEKSYDGYIHWQNEMSVIMTDFENSVSSGTWYPGR